MSDEKVTVGALCRGCRSILGWSQGNLADKVNLAVTTIARIEQASVSPKHENVMALYRVFQNAGITIAQDKGSFGGVFTLTIDVELLQKNMKNNKLK